MRNEAGRGREGALSLLQPGQMLAEGLSMLDGEGRHCWRRKMY